MSGRERESISRTPIADALHEAYMAGFNDAGTEQDALDADAFTEAGIALSRMCALDSGERPEPVAWRLTVDGEGPEYATLHKTWKEAEAIAKRDDAVVAVIEPLYSEPVGVRAPESEREDDRDAWFVLRTVASLLNFGAIGSARDAANAAVRADLRRRAPTESRAGEERHEP